MNLSITKIKEKDKLNLHYQFFCKNKVQLNDTYTKDMS